MLVMTGCFTGVESTPKITERDVEKAQIAVRDKVEFKSSLPIYADSLPSWRDGKRFHVVDDQARLIFGKADVPNLTTGSLLYYKGYTESTSLDGRKVVTIDFTTEDGEILSYATTKTIDEFTSMYTIPFLVDDDMVNFYNCELSGKELWIKTSIWYDPQSLEMRSGLKYVKVRIDGVEAGNKVFPLRVTFTPLSGKGEPSMVWMALNNSTMHGRDFDSMFSLTDIRNDYPAIDNDTWNLIVKGEVKAGMNKNECRLSLGSPKSISQRPDHTGVKEYWFYDGGTYLFFVDGLLKEYRR